MLHRAVVVVSSLVFMERAIAFRQSLPPAMARKRHKYNSDTREKSAEVRAQRDALQGTYLKSVAEIEGILAGMSESSASLAEWNFEEKRSKFVKFVERVRDKLVPFVENRRSLRRSSIPSATSCRCG